ncbi:hypothetical protein AAG906_016693 [Vitis piasezkii]
MIGAETQYSQVEQTALTLKDVIRNDRTHKPATPSYPTQIGLVQTNIEMGHRVK